MGPPTADTSGPARIGAGVSAVRYCEEPLLAFRRPNRRGDSYRGESADLLRLHRRRDSPGEAGAGHGDDRGCFRDRFLGLSASGGQLPKETEGRIGETVGPIFGIIGVTIMIVQGAMMGGLAHRIGEQRLVRIGAFILAAALFWIGTTESLLWMKI